MSEEDFVIDLTEVPDLEAVPQGEYLARIYRAEFNTSREKKTPMLTVGYEVIEGEFAGRKVPFDNWMLSGGGAPITKRRLAALDIPVDVEYSVPELQELLIGMECQVRIKHEMYEGEVRARVSRTTGVSPSFGGEDVSEMFGE